jgi:hypothetical protein
MRPLLAVQQKHSNVYANGSEIRATDCAHEA